MSSKTPSESRGEPKIEEKLSLQYYVYLGLEI